MLPVRRTLPKVYLARYQFVMGGSFRNLHHYEENISQASDSVMLIQTRADAKKVVAALMKHPNHPFACDTEVCDINVRTEGPVGNGKVTCISIYGGPNIDFGGNVGCTLWVDNYGSSHGVLQEFKDWFQSPEHKKIWHNYGFDRHVLQNEGGCVTVTFV